MRGQASTPHPVGRHAGAGQTPYPVAKAGKHVILDGYIPSQSKHIGNAPPFSDTLAWLETSTVKGQDFTVAFVLETKINTTTCWQGVSLADCLRLQKFALKMMDFVFKMMILTVLEEMSGGAGSRAAGGGKYSPRRWAALDYGSRLKTPGTMAGLDGR